MSTPRKGHARKPIPMTEDGVIEMLVGGMSIKAICLAHNYAGTNSFYRMKKNNPTFAERVDNIMDAPHRKLLEAAAVAPAKVDSGLTWQELYLTSFRQYKDRVRAADACGKKLSEIFMLLDPGNEDHDAEFAAAVREEEIRTAVYVEDSVLRKATVEGDYNAQKLILPTMPVIGEKYRKDNAAAAPTSNLFFFADPAALDGVRDKLSSLFPGPEVKEISG